MYEIEEKLVGVYVLTFFCFDLLQHLLCTQKFNVLRQYQVELRFLLWSRQRQKEAEVVIDKSGVKGGIRRSGEKSIINDFPCF